MDDPNCDGVLAILTPQAMSDPTGTAKALIEVARSHQLKPLLTSFMGATINSPWDLHATSTMNHE